MLRAVVDDLYQIGECVDGSHGHEAVRVYVLLNDGHPILVDSGSHLHRSGLMTELIELLQGSVPEYVFLTHSELPHSGNMEVIAEQWPSINVMVSSIFLPYIELAPVLPLEQITTVAPGSTLELAGRELTFLDALIKDQPGSQWIHDLRTSTLFTADAFGYYHPADQCEPFSDEMEGGVPVDAFRRYHQNAFRFLRWVVPERLNSVLDKLFLRRDVRIIAPIHGNAIRSNTSEHLDRLKQALTIICTEYRKEGAYPR